MDARKDNDQFENALHFKQVYIKNVFLPHCTPRAKLQTFHFRIVPIVYMTTWICPFADKAFLMRRMHMMVNLIFPVEPPPAESAFWMAFEPTEI
jgi:hypothetical protein